MSGVRIIFFPLLFFKPNHTLCVNLISVESLDSFRVLFNVLLGVFNPLFPSRLLGCKVCGIYIFMKYSFVWLEVWEGGRGVWGMGG
jgi:hypothetical protein